MNIGNYNELTILGKSNDGYFLDGAVYGNITLVDSEKKQFSIGEKATVFIYTVNDGELKATLKKPLAKVGEFAFLQLIDFNRTGFFMDWGIDKDLFLPFKNKKEEMTVGNSYPVYLYLDKISQRVVADAKLDKHLIYSKNYELNQEVDVLLYERTELGFKGIINNDCSGLLYHKNLFQKVDVGDRIKAYIYKVRDDGKIDLSLSRKGYYKDEELISSILNLLKKNNGVLNISDKSDPDLIYRTFSVSKAQYKKAIGRLYKEKKISIENNKIKSV